MIFEEIFSVVSNVRVATIARREWLLDNTV
jgi:hypothetical protein